MREIKESVESSSPLRKTIGNAYKGGLMERWALKRISSVAFYLPEKFDESAPAGMLRVYGGTTDKHTVINIEEVLSRENEGAMQFTDIDLVRNSMNPRLLEDLSAERYVSDDIGELYGVESPHQTYELGAEDNSLSLLRVMRSVSLATRTVEGQKTLEYLSRPESDFLQTL